MKFYENGIMNSKEGALASGLALSKKTGRPVVVTFNSSEGLVPDLAQCVLDKVDPLGLVHANRAADSQAELMYAAASSDHPQTFVAHSQGAIITRDALIRTHARLYGEKFTETLKRTHDPLRAHLEAQRYADDKMKNVRVITAGGAAQVWPPYANVTHVTNVADAVPNLFGQTVLLDPVETARELLPPGAPLPDGDRPDVVVIDRPTDPRDGGFPGHSFEGVYLDEVAKKV